jgi:hypothetical protein
VRGYGDVSFAPVAGMLAAEAHRRADAQAALAGKEPQHDDQADGP